MLVFIGEIREATIQFFSKIIHFSNISYQQFQFYTSQKGEDLNISSFLRLKYFLTLSQVFFNYDAGQIEKCRCNYSQLLQIRLH